MTKLFNPFSIRGVPLKNRIVMAPMCTKLMGYGGM